jgi:RNA polymerase sigma-70 factor (ECF subfamily)
MALAVEPLPLSSLSDLALATRIAQGDRGAFTTVMRRHNQLLYRTARAILRDDADAEDALQDAYLKAYARIGTFSGDARLSTWLVRIVVNEALGRLRQRKRDQTVVPFSPSRERPSESEEDMVPGRHEETPENMTLRAEMRKLLERSIDELPVAFRTVFILREVEEMTVEETALALQIPSGTVRTRLFRAMSLLRESLAREMELSLDGWFEFAGARCDRIVARVLKELESARTAVGPITPS